MQETQETRVRSLGQENPLEGMATHSSLLAWRIPWTEEPGGYSSWGCKEWDLTEHRSTRVWFHLEVGSHVGCPVETGRGRGRVQRLLVDIRLHAGLTLSLLDIFLLLVVEIPLEYQPCHASFSNRLGAVVPNLLGTWDKILWRTVSPWLGAVLWAMGGSCKYRGSFSPSPTAHLLLCHPVPKEPVQVCDPEVGTHGIEAMIMDSGAKWP